MAPLPKLDDDQNIPQYDGNVTLDLLKVKGWMDKVYQMIIVPPLSLYQ